MPEWLGNALRVHTGRIVFGVVCVGAVALLFSVAGASVAHALLWGERATAYVAECHYEYNHRDSPTRQVCMGSWQTEGGRRGSGYIEGVSDDDVHKSRSVRLGLSRDEAYAGSFRDHPIAFAPLLPVGVALLCLWTWRRSKKNAKADPLVRLWEADYRAEDTRGLAVS